MKAHRIWTAQERDVLHRAIKEEIKKQNIGYSLSLDEAILYALYKRFGFGKKRLREYYEAFFDEREKLKEYYEMPDDAEWLVHRELLNIGVDVEQWNKERGVL